MLAFVDIETTGLENYDLILEVGLEITRDDLTFVAQEAYVINDGRDPDQIHRMMPELVKKMHTQSGLLAAIPGGVSLRYAEVRLTEAMNKYCGGVDTPMAGSSVHFDRAFLKRQMPRFETMFHYRNVDLSTVRGLAQRWRPDLCPPEGRKIHRAIPDLEDTIAEAKFFKAHLF